MNSPIPDDLKTWVAELRASVDRGDLAKLGSIDLGSGTAALPAEYTVRIMLADLHDLEAMTPDEANDPVNVAHRARLLADFRLLQFLLG